MIAAQPSTPWYREPWPWILMSGPATVVVAALFTAFLAVRSSDGVIADDYYKQGLAINRTIEKGARARLLGVDARMTLDRNEVVVTLASHAPPPPRLRLSLVHPTRPGVDQAVTLVRGADGHYVGQADTSRTASWLVALEDDGGTWRVGGRWHADRRSVTLVPTD